MSKILDSKTFGDKLYKSLPQIYRTADKDVDYSLKRYFQSLSDGGFSHIIDETNDLMSVVDSDKTSMKNLPSLFKSYGLEIFNGVPEMYLRKLLPLVGNLFSQKGSITPVEYLTSLISGVKSTVAVSETFRDDHSLNVTLEMDYGQEQKDIPDKEQLVRIIKEFVPFFCNVTIVYSYFLAEELKIYLHDELGADTYASGEDGALKATDEEERKISIVAVTETINPSYFADYNSLLGDTTTVLGSTFILNNINSYDIIKKNGEEEFVFT